MLYNFYLKVYIFYNWFFPIPCLSGYRSQYCGGGGGRTEGGGGGAEGGGGGAEGWTSPILRLDTRKRYNKNLQ